MGKDSHVKGLTGKGITAWQEGVARSEITGELVYERGDREGNVMNTGSCLRL